MFNLSDPAFIADPYPHYDLLREHAPLCDVPGLGCLVSRYADVSAVLRSGKLLRTLQRIPLGVRPVLNSVFSPRAVTDMRPRIQELTDLLLDLAFVEGTADLVPDIAYRLPATVVLEILGVPAADHRQVTDWVVDASLLEFGSYVRRLADLRRSRPVDDLLSRLALAVPDEELVPLALVIVTGALETTANSIANCVFALLREPARYKELGLYPSLSAAAAEELLRFEPTAQMLPPWVVAEEMEIGGRTFGLGDVVITVIGAANRDPAMFPHADLLDFHRPSNPHLGFGVGSVVCPASLLGRMEVETVCATLARRFPDAALDPLDYPAFRPDPMVRGLRSLKVTLG